jgi:phage terminase large subunit GpA-like protein
MSVMLANPRRFALEAIAEVLLPPPPVDYEAWARRNITFAQRESPYPGPYNPDLFPFLTEIYRALSPEDPCRIVSVKGSAQVGKTILATVFAAGSQDLDPCDFFYVQNTEENARRWSKLKLAPLIRNSPRLRAIFPEKSRDGGDSVLFKECADGRGSITMTGANSPASLSQVSMRRQVHDDISKWENNAAGDPEVQADSRSRAFEFAKILKISTPLVLPGCRITRAYEAGSQEGYFVPCPHCGHEQTLEIENLLANLDEDAPEKTCFSCIECGGLIQAHHIAEIVRRGHWVARNPKAMREHRSFEIWSAYSRLQSLERIAREWLAARGVPDRERTFYNDSAGRPYQVKGEAPPWEDLRNRAENTGHRRATIPAAGLVVTIGVDCNGDWLNWQAVAWTRDHRRFVVDYGRIDGAIADAKAWAALDALVVSKWRHASGAEVGCDLMAIDGNAWTEDVWNWARRWPTSKVIMVRGLDGDDKPLIAKVKRERSRRTGKVLKYQSRFYNFATSILKWSLYRSLLKADPLMAGYVGFPKGLADDYFKELTSERRIEIRARDGSTRFGWDLPEGLRNEALDTMMQAEAAAIKFGVRDLPPAIWDRLEAERARPIEGAQLDFEDAAAALSLAQPPAPPAAPAKPKRRLSDIGGSP